MNPSEEYQEDQLITQNRYLELQGEYTSLPMGTQPSELLAQELDQLEMRILDQPPVYKVLDPEGNETGELGVRQKGLNFPSTQEVEYARSLPTGDFEVIDQSKWLDYIGGQDACDLSSLVYHKLDQDGTGSCGFEALANGIHISHTFATDEVPPELNPLFGYHTTSGGRDQGSSLPSNIKFALEFGCATAAVWPRTNGWRMKPSAEAYEDAKMHKLIVVYKIRNWGEFGSALIYGWPVYFGYSGHAILAVKLLDLNRLKYINSWSGDWGDQGFGTLSKDRIYWGYEVFAIRTVTYYSAAA